jgi:hypothetical protein
MEVLTVSFIDTHTERYLCKVVSSKEGVPKEIYTQLQQ